MSIVAGTDGVYARAGIWESQGDNEPMYDRLLEAFGPDVSPLMLIQAATYAKDFGLDINDPEVVQRIRAVAVSRTSVSDARVVRAALEPPPTPGSVVYFIQVGALIKIGTTRRTIQQRMTSMQLPPSAKVVGLIPNAGQPQEAALHLRFAAYRRGGEWFELHPELEALIAKHPA